MPVVRVVGLTAARCEEPTPETVEACKCCRHTVKVPENLQRAVALFTGARTLPHVFIVQMKLDDGTTVKQAMMNRHQIEALPELVAKITWNMDSRNTRLKVLPEDIQAMYKSLAAELDAKDEVSSECADEA